MKPILTMHPNKQPIAGFTLIEIMMVLAIIGLVLGFGLPKLLRWDLDQSLPSVMTQLVDLCNTARNRAILKNQPVELVFRPRERVAFIEGAENTESSRTRVAGLPTVRTRVQFPDSVYFEMLDVSFQEYKDLEECRVTFFPNGTSEELTLILRSSDGRFAKLALEFATALPKVEFLR